MYIETTLGGYNEMLVYSIRYPKTGNEMIDEYLSDIAADAEYYFNNGFKRVIEERLVKHKKGRAYGDFEITFEGDDLLSVIIMISGYDGNELVFFDHECINLDGQGELIPERSIRSIGKTEKRKRRGRKRNYFVDADNKVCVTEKTSEKIRLKIRRKELRGLIKISEKYERIT